MENTEKQPQSAEFFAVTLSIFQIVGEVSVDVLDLNAYVHDWGRLLLGHRHEEVCIPRGATIPMLTISRLSEGIL